MLLASGGDDDDDDDDDDGGGGEDADGTYDSIPRASRDPKIAPITANAKSAEHACFRPEIPSRNASAKSAYLQVS